MLPSSEWEADPTAGNDSAKKPYSVLLLYPDYANDSGTETYYAFVEATDPIEAVAMAQREAVTTQDGMDGDPEDFAPAPGDARPPLQRTIVQQMNQPQPRKDSHYDLQRSHLP